MTHPLLPVMPHYFLGIFGPSAQLNLNRAGTCSPASAAYCALSYVRFFCTIEPRRVAKMSDLKLDT